VLLNASEQSDEALMACAQDNDANAFAQLYDRHARRAFRVARAVCRDASRAEDAVQEGFLAIWRNRANYLPQIGTFQAWSMKIVQNRAIDSYRNAATRPPPQAGARSEETPAPDAVSASPQDEAIARSESEVLRASLHRLPKAQAKVIALAFYGGLSHAEIATQLDLPKGTVKGQMRLGLEKLRSQMGVPG
jgi:RNA polymerase sigma-70 factor (ECF subfamily)